MTIMRDGRFTKYFVTVQEYLYLIFLLIRDFLCRVHYKFIRTEINLFVFKPIVFLIKTYFYLKYWDVGLYI